MAKLSIALVATFALVFLTSVRARDPELLTDFAIPEGVDESQLDGTFFTYTGLRGGAPAPPGGLGYKPVTVRNFPALDGMGISMELVEYAPGAVNVPHVHPRGSEILYVVEGTLTVGQVDGTGKLFRNVLQKDDVFLFPKGLPHYQANFDQTSKAVVVMIFGSANIGYVSLPQSLFGSGISDGVLTKSFNVPADIITLLREGQSPNAII